MDKNDVIDYVMNTPGNTNRAVLSSMLDSMESGAIEMETVFEEDIIFTYSQGNKSNSAAGVFEDRREIILSHKYTKITLDDMTFKSLPFDSGNYIGINETNSLTLSLSSDIYNFFIEVYYYGPNTNNNTINACVYGSLSDDPDLQAYCQTPHHLKIELFDL